MDQRLNIQFMSTPIIWIIDKYKTGLNNPLTYIIAIIPGVLGVVGLIADVRTIFDISNNSFNAFLIISSFLFIYGIINIFIVVTNQRQNVRLKRHEANVHIIHKNVIEQIREYRASYKAGLKSHEIINWISRILKDFNTSYMKSNHNGSVAAAIKYVSKSKLHPIRDCENPETRTNTPEDISNSYIYNAINEAGKKMRFIYVKNIKKPDNYECLALGKYKDEVISRAKSNYSTFIALPIRAGKLPASSDAFQVRADLGLLGFDLVEPYGFGNLYDHEVDLLGCFADIMSEPLEDLQKAITNESRPPEPQLKAKNESGESQGEGR